MSVTFRGPVFDGRAQRAYEKMADEMEREVAKEGKDIVKDILSKVLRNPTGYYESRIAIDRVGPGTMVHDSKVIYGRWLEGVNAQNETSRFKGYHTFQLATWHLRQRVQLVIKPIVAKYLRRMQ